MQEHHLNHEFQEIPMFLSDEQVDSLGSSEIKKRIEAVRTELIEFAKQNNFHSLEDRINRGLETIGMVAVSEVREYAEKLAAVIGAKDKKTEDDEAEGFEDIVMNVHRGGPWKYAEEMTGENPSSEMKMFMILNAIQSIDIPREKDLNEKEFLKHVEHVKTMLLEAIQNPDVFFEKAKKENLETSAERMRYEDGIPISEMDKGFVPVALQGYEAGIVQDADGTPLVGSKCPIDPMIFEHWGLVKKMEDDGRGRVVPTYYNSDGQKLFRHIFPGFLVIDAKTFPLASAIVRAIEMVADGVPVYELEIPSSDILGVTLYVPTSSEGEDEDSSSGKKLYFLRQNRFDEKIPGEKLIAGEGTALVPVQDAFYHAMEWIKAHVVALDAVKFGEKKVPLTDAEKEALYKKVDEKMEQKMDELRYLVDIIEKEVEKLKIKKPFIVQDMAGGAGDLALAVATSLLGAGKNLQSVEIIDPFSKIASLDDFTDRILGYLPLEKELRELVVHTNESLQQAEIESNSIVVAKHPCGDLSDLIIEKWVDSESPLLVIMTCCQDKACGCPARYDISQSDWNAWCRDSSRTNVILPEKQEKGYEKAKKKLEGGKEAMLKLDMARVAYLRRHGFDAELLTTDKFPKGDVIIARRTPKNKSLPRK